MPKLSVVQTSPATVADLQPTEAEVKSMTFSAADAKLLGEYARVAATRYHENSAYLRLHKISDAMAYTFEQQAVTAELLGSIIASQVG